VSLGDGEQRRPVGKHARNGDPAALRHDRPDLDLCPLCESKLCAVAGTAKQIELFG
jgi:hypothetical protein